jgi:hypothetical protein
MAPDRDSLSGFFIGVASHDRVVSYHTDVSLPVMLNVSIQLIFRHSFFGSGFALS